MSLDCMKIISVYFLQAICAIRTSDVSEPLCAYLFISLQTDRWTDGREE